MDPKGGTNGWRSREVPADPLKAIMEAKEWLDQKEAMDFAIHKALGLPYARNPEIFLEGNTFDVLMKKLRKDPPPNFVQAPDTSFMGVRLHRLAEDLPGDPCVVPPGEALVFDQVLMLKQFGWKALYDGQW